MTRNGNLPWEAVRQRVKISKLSMVQYNLNVIEAINCVYVRFINFEKKKKTGRIHQDTKFCAPLHPNCLEKR